MVQSLLRKLLPTVGGEGEETRNAAVESRTRHTPSKFAELVVAHSCSFKEILECAEVKASVDRHSVQALRLVFEFTERKRGDPVIH